MVCFAFLTCTWVPATAARTFSTCQLPKVVRAWCVLHILVLACALGHNGMHFFDISISKWRTPNMVCFAHFDLDMCFAPQWCALLRHLNFQNWSKYGVCLCILMWKCASCHNRVPLFISLLARWLRTRCFSEPTFRPPLATNQWKKTHRSRRCYLFAHLHLLSSDSLHLLSSDSFSSLLFFLPLFSLALTPSAFPSVHIIRSLTSEFPSIIFQSIDLSIYQSDSRSLLTYHSISCAYLYFLHRP